MKTPTGVAFSLPLPSEHTKLSFLALGDDIMRRRMGRGYAYRIINTILGLLAG